jgi:hypothetical protein
MWIISSKNNLSKGRKGKMKNKKRHRSEPPENEWADIEESMKDLMNIDNPTIITIYGKPGTGKTTFGGTLPKPLLILDVKDKGTDSAKRRNTQRGEVTVMSINSFDDIMRVYDYIKAHKTKFKSVLIDHMTALQDKALEKIKDEEGKDLVSQRMFGMAAGLLKEVISLYKDLTDWGILPCFICQDRMESGEGEGEDQLIPEVGPGMMPSVARTLCAASRIIGHAYLQERKEQGEGGKIKHQIEYRLRLGPNPFYITKVTRPVGTPCPAYLVNPTYPDLEKVITGQWIDKVKKKGHKTRKKGS